MKKFAALLVPIFLTSIFVSGAHGQSSDTRQGAITAFNDISSSHSKVIKWTNDIHVGVLSTGGVDTEWVELSLRTLKELESFAPVKMQYRTDKTNFGIVFVDDNDAGIRNYNWILQRVLMGTDGVARFRSSLEQQKPLCSTVTATGKSSIAYHLVWVFTKAPHPKYSIENCIKRSIATGFGIGWHETSALSMFNPKLNLPDYSDVDKLLIETYFKANLPAGMPIEDAQKKFADYVSGL